MNKLQIASLNYIKAIEDRLKISYNSDEPIFIPDRVSQSDIKGYKQDVYDIYKGNLEDLNHQLYLDGEKIIQSIGYGYVEDFEKFIKVGMLYSNRVVLWDYLWGRVLRDPDKYTENIDHIGFVANNLLRLKRAVEDGGIVILPHPGEWSPHARLCINELFEKPAQLSNSNYGLVSAMSVASDLNLHPYTLHEGDDTNALSFQNSELKNEDKDRYICNITDLMERQPFELINDISAVEFYKFLQQTPDFFSEFRDAFLIKKNGDSNAEINQMFEAKKHQITKEFIARQKKRELSFDQKANAVSLLAGAGQFLTNLFTGNVAGAIWNISKLSPSLAKHIYDSNKRKDTNTIVMGFEKLHDIVDAKKIKP